MRFLFTILCFLSVQLLFSQSLSGIWEGNYTHFRPTCCNEDNYHLRLKIYEDARGALWIESQTIPYSDEHAIGQMFTAGYKLADGRIALNDVDITFSTLRYTTTCFNTCKWCIKEYLLNYSKQGKNEILTGLWNSRSCFPGGIVLLKKINDLPTGENITLIKLGQSEKINKDPKRYERPLFKFIKSENQNEIGITLGYYNSAKLKVDNLTDFDNEENFIIQNVTMHLGEGGHYQVITYFELKDKRNGKIYPFNLGNIKKDEIRDLPFAPSGLTFPDEKGWDEIFAQYEKQKENSTTEVNNSSQPDNDEPVTQIKNRNIVVRQSTINIKKSSTVFVEVWDNNIVDGDIISLYVNNTCVLNKYTLAKEKKAVKNLPLKNGKNTITMFAENLGDIPPNTASMSIYIDNKLLRTFLLESDMELNEALEIMVE